MKNKKEFIGIFLSVMISVFLIGLGVYATTTINSNIVTGGSMAVGMSGVGSNTFEVDGTASISGDLIISGSSELGDTVSDESVIMKTKDTNTTVTTNGAEVLKIVNYDQTDDNVAAIHFGSKFTGPGFSPSGQSSAGLGAQFLDHVRAGDYDWPTDLYFWTGSGGMSSNPASEKMRIKATGEVGIGDTSPSYKLSVDGTASVSDEFYVGAAGVSLTTGTASISGNCTVGSIYIRAAAGIDNIISVCDATNEWTAADL